LSSFFPERQNDKLFGVEADMLTQRWTWLIYPLTTLGEIVGEIKRLFSINEIKSTMLP
jgi:hypothetical protein